MREDEEIEIIYKSKEELEKIISKIKNLKFDELKKKRYYEISVLEKNTDEIELKEYFTKFDKIKLIFWRKRASGYNNYDFHYEKEDGTYFIYAINIEMNPPELINAFHAKKSFKNFVKIISRRYWNKIV